MSDTFKKRAVPLLGKAWKGLRFMLAALILPPVDVKIVKKAARKRKWMPFSFRLNLKKTLVSFAVFGLLQPLSLFLFPRLDSVLKKEKIDAKTVQSVTRAKNIRVVSNNFGGRLYYIFDAVPYLNPTRFVNTLKDVFSGGIVGFEQDNAGGSYAKRLIAGDAHIIIVKSGLSSAANERAMAGMIEELTDGKYTFKIPYSAEVSRQMVLLHEIRHTDPANAALGPLFRESDADYHACLAVAALHHDPRIAQAINNGMTFGYGGSKEEYHNTTLYLCRKFNHQAVPSEAEIMRANSDAQPVIEERETLYVRELGGAKPAAIKKQAQRVESMRAKLSPLANERFRDFEAAWDACIVLKPALPPVPRTYVRPGA